MRWLFKNSVLLPALEHRGAIICFLALWQRKAVHEDEQVRFDWVITYYFA